MNTITRSIALSLLSLLFGVSVAAAGATVTHSKFHGRTVSAVAQVSDGCSSRETFAQGADISEQFKGGPPSTESRANINGNEFNCLTKTGYFFYSLDTLALDVFEIAGNEASASLEAKVRANYCEYTYIPDFEVSCRDAIASVKMNAEAISGPHKESQHDTVTFPDGTQYKTYLKGTVRDAEAAGTVTIEGHVLPLGEGDYTQASIASNNIGGMSIEKP
jgi:hypothetical protein